jgi:hypothetical protein
LALFVVLVMLAYPVLRVAMVASLAFLHAGTAGGDVLRWITKQLPFILCLLLVALVAGPVRRRARAIGLPVWPVAAALVIWTFAEQTIVMTLTAAGPVPPLSWHYLPSLLFLSLLAIILLAAFPDGNDGRIGFFRRHRVVSCVAALMLAPSLAVSVFYIVTQTFPSVNLWLLQTKATGSVVRSIYQLPIGPVSALVGAAGLLILLAADWIGRGRPDLPPNA